MKKKVFSLFLSVLMLMSVVAALPASATAAQKGDIYNGQFHGTLELKMSPTLRVGEKISGAIDVNGYPLRFTGDASYFGRWRDKTNSNWYDSGELLAEKGHKYEYTATLMYSNVGDVRFDEIDGVTVNGVSVDYTTAGEDDVIRIKVPYDVYIEVINCTEMVNGNQWFIPGQSVTFRSKLGSADANNHLAWGYSVADEPYEFDVETAYVYDHTFFRITVQNDYPGDCVYVHKFTCKPEADKAVAATCTKSGLTEGSHCQYCKKVLTEQKATPATGHRYIPSQESYPNPKATLSKDCLLYTSPSPRDTR